jgi:hypothetical protein
VYIDVFADVGTSGTYLSAIALDRWTISINKSKRAKPQSR